MCVKVSIYTQVYNTEKYLKQCISSVLNQSFTNFEYIVVDNGCTDGSSEILRKFEEQDKRINLIRHEENKSGFWHRVICEKARGEFVTTIDSDDWWEPDYLERMLSFAQKHNLDIAGTGSCMHIVATGEYGKRELKQPLIMGRSQFSVGYPYYHAFMRPVWGKLIRMDVVRHIDIDVMQKLTYVRDTWYCFQLLRHANRIGIDNSVLHHYRIHKKSLYRQYDPRRFDADVYLYNDALDFLKPYGPISQRNREFIAAVYANAVTDTLNVVHGANISAADKLKEYRRIAEHPITKDVYRLRQEPEKNSRINLLRATAVTAGAAGSEDACAVAHALSPNCGAAVSKDAWGLFLREPKLFTALEKDDAGELMEGILELIEQGKYTKQYDLGAMAEALIPDGSPLKGVNDAKFYKRYMPLCKLTIEGRFADALDYATDLLLGGEPLYDGERLLRLYLMLAALTEVVPAYLFGNIRLAELYLNEGRREECAAILKDLEEMGAGEHEEVIALNSRLRGTK